MRMVVCIRDLTKSREPSEFAMTCRMRKHTLGDNYFGANPFVANPFVAPVTYSNFYNGNATGFQKASGGLTHADRVGFEDILNHTQSITRRFEEALKDFISEQRGVLEEEPHTPQPAQPHTSESEAERVPPRKGRYLNVLYFVDEHGVTQKMKLKVRDAHNLPSGIRVVVDYDDNFQPIGEACGLLAGVCGQLAGNHILLPISFENWSFVPDTYKDTIWESALKTRFCFKVNEDLAKRDVMFKIGKLWREYRCKLWNEFYDPLLSRNDLIKNIPDGLSMEQWAIFVDYRLKPSTVKLCNRNRDIRKKQTIPHTGGAMPLSRRRDNLKIETGREIGRAEMWKITHKRKNGTYVNDEAMDIGEKIDELMLQNPDTASDISPNDPAPDVGSDAPSSNQNIRSSGGSKTN
ncbi:hypothetical protein VNO80_16304 [Phaseolus coccineus]|uniref:Uncharacterized protein n=1 Tax=Phaseolus coccineus TaxID=3886 RepID=A0AAN9MT12_PHACN